MQNNTRIWLGNALFTMILMFLCIGFDSFRAHEVVLSSTSSPLENSLSYVFILLFLILSYGFIYYYNIYILKIAYTPILKLIFIWLFISCIISLDRSLSLKRYILFLLSFNLFASVFLLVSSRNAMAIIFAGVMVLILMLSYFGFIFLPNLSIHQASDMTEAHLAGDLRGIWSHKNRAGPILATMIFISFFLFYLKKYIFSSIIFIFATIFFIFTGAKTSQISFFLSLFTVIPAYYTNSIVLRNSLLLSSPILLNFIGAGTSIFPFLQPLLLNLPIDPTFTGRTETWGVMIDNLKGYWILGQGYASFWESAVVMSGRIENKTRGYWANHGHQGLLDLTLNIGLIGVFLFIVWAFYQPLKDFNRALKNGHDKATLFLLVILWQYWLSIGAMESIFLERMGLEWFMLCFAIFGLRYMSQYDINKGDYAL